MQANLKFIVLAGAFLFAACAPKVVIPPEQVRVEAGYELFQKAEGLFEAKSYDQALETYNAYILRFPEKPPAAAALMKIGAIRQMRENYAAARNIYERLIATYSESPFLPDAKVEILVTYYKEGQYETVISEAEKILPETVSPFHVVRIYTVLGDTYMAMGSAREAVRFYAQVYQELEEPEKESILVKLNRAIDQLRSADIVSLLESPESGLPEGDLRYQLGIRYAEEEKYDDALRVLSEFLTAFPDHAKVPQVERLTKELQQRSIYGHYTIGCLLPLSGPFQFYGNRALKGIELALDQFSSKDKGATIRITIEDTGSNPDTAARAVREMYREHVAAIIGPVVTAERAAFEAQVHGMPIITLTQKDKVPDIGDYVFRNFLTPRMQVEAIVAHAIETLGLSRFAILYPEENYGKTFMNLFWDEVIAYGGTVVGVESYELAQTDFADPIRKLVGLYYEVPEDLKESGTENENEHEDENEDADADEEPEPIVDFDALFIPDAPKKAGLIIPQLAYYDVGDISLFGTNLWHSEQLIDMTYRYAQGALMADGFFAEDDSPSVREFVRVFQETYGETPGFIEAVTYDSAMILFEIVSRPGIRFRSSLKEELMNLVDFEGVTGLTTFDRNGEVLKNPYLLRIKGDRFVPIDSY